jgi:histidine triad (HIT) family protein
MTGDPTVSCLVCRKHRGEIQVPGGAIYRDELVFLSHSLISAKEEAHYLGHLFVEPQRHVAELADLTDREAETIGLWTKRVAAALIHVLGMEHVYAFVIGDGVPHVHIHVIGRYPGAPREYWGPKVDEWPGAPKGDSADIGRTAGRVRTYLQEQYPMT